MKNTNALDSLILSPYMQERLKNARFVLASDVDETLTRKKKSRVELNEGVLPIIGLNAKELPYLRHALNQAEEAFSTKHQFFIATTGRTLPSSFNWLEELGKGLKEVHAPDVLICNNGEEAYLNEKGHKTWWDFMKALQKEPMQKSWLLYEEVLNTRFASHIDQIKTQEGKKAPLNSALRDLILKSVQSKLKDSEISRETIAHKGFRRLLEFLRQQEKLCLSEAFWIQQSLSNQEVEHLVVCFFNVKDAKPLIQSVGTSPSQINVKQFLEETCKVPSEGMKEWLLQHLPKAHRSLEPNVLLNFITELKNHVEQELAVATPFLNLHVETQAKGLEKETLVWQGTNSPRAYLLVTGKELLNKGKSLEILLQCFQNLLPTFSPQACLTVGDGAVDFELLAPQKIAGISNYPTVVCNSVLEEQSRLFQQVKGVHPSVKFANGFYPQLA